MPLDIFSSRTWTFFLSFFVTQSDPSRFSIGPVSRTLFHDLFAFVPLDLRLVMPLIRSIGLTHTITSFSRTNLNYIQLLSSLRSPLFLIKSDQGKLLYRDRAQGQSRVWLGYHFTAPFWVPTWEALLRERPKLGPRLRSAPPDLDYRTQTLQTQLDTPANPWNNERLMARIDICYTYTHRTSKRERQVRSIK
ncbi:hypothetical protein SISSUDRAFT_843687 [Sistotremastrum suecicum HHB10207 ss-3]|uniref:Uncharacterized protein n=1 Tax=Sistotremastrum suecicum HHB10207 ss-3 TaxID=1314776 RepID=A0A166HHY4_9AGAM|nr:hypothetical protein SISSUDRAFT_843687 [Sistotremastrum suecicum HHB10207 ss-3]